MSEREPSTSYAWRHELGWAAAVTAVGALVAYSMGQPGNEPLQAAAMVLIVLAAAQATVVVVALVREVVRVQRATERGESG
jgi:hypothetical protein